MLNKKRKKKKKEKQNYVFHEETGDVWQNDSFIHKHLLLHTERV